MTSHTGIVCYGVILTLATFAGLLPVLTEGNVIDQRALQRELGESSPAEIMSLIDKDEFRELGEPAVAVNDYNNIVKTKVRIHF